MGEIACLLCTYFITSLKSLSQTKIDISYLYIKYLTVSAKVDESLCKNKRISLKTVKFLLFNREYTNLASRLSNLIDIHFTIPHTILL